MYAITGITGRVGGGVAERLIAEGRKVRAVVRDAAKGEGWRRRGCEVAVAALDDQVALERAFADVEGVFFLLPPVFDPEPDFGEARRVIAAVRAALLAAGVPKLVSLSTIGAQASETNLLTQHALQEAELGSLPIPATFLRAAWFMENAAWDVEAARTTGVVPTFLQPTDRRIPMVATADVSLTAAQLIQENWGGKRVVELESARISPDDLAHAFSRAIGRAVHMESVPRDSWETLFRDQGMRDPMPRIRMLDGFNEGWIAFEGRPESIRRGTTGIDDVVATLLQSPEG